MWALPMPTPLPTPIPFKARVIASSLPVARSPAARASLGLAEPVPYQLLQFTHCRRGVVAVGAEIEFRDPGRGQHPHAHDALAVHHMVTAREPHLAFETGSELDKLCRRPRMQTELVDDSNPLALHHHLSLCGSYG